MDGARADPGRTAQSGAAAEGDYWMRAPGKAAQRAKTPQCLDLSARKWGCPGRKYLYYIDLWQKRESENALRKSRRTRGDVIRAKVGCRRKSFAGKQFNGKASKRIQHPHESNAPRCLRMSRVLSPPFESRSAWNSLATIALQSPVKTPCHAVTFGHSVNCQKD